MNCARCRLVRVLELGTTFNKPFIRPIRPNWAQQNIQRLPQRLRFSTTTRPRQQRSGNIADDDPAWISVVDRDPVIVKVKEGHGPGIILLGLSYSSPLPSASASPFTKYVN
jgi:hypothetical protein